MTHSPSDLDALDRHLADSLAGAHSDPRWAGEPWPDPLARIGRARRTGTRRVMAVSVLASAVLVAAAVLGGSALRSSTDRVRVLGPADASSTGSGLDWLLPLDKYRAHQAATPAPSPGWTRVPSPAPLDDQVTGLEADLRAAVPPGVHVLRKDAADGGAKGIAVVEMRLPDGTPLVAVRKKLDYPVPLAAYTGSGAPDPGMADEHFTDPLTWSDGTAYSVITGSSWGYSLPAAEGGDSWSGPYVDIATPDGWFTEISAPVSTSTLLAWAQAIDAHFAGA